MFFEVTIRNGDKQEQLLLDGECGILWDMDGNVKHSDLDDTEKWTPLDLPNICNLKMIASLELLNKCMQYQKLERQKTFGKVMAIGLTSFR